jgi:hypothetical protein
MSLNIEYVGIPQKRRPGNPNWQKGRSGNPNGAPKRYEGPTLPELCKAHTVEAVKTLIVMMRFKGPNQLPAAIALLDRGWGKPAQKFETDGDSPIHLHLIAAQLVQAQQLEGQAEPEQPRQPLTIDGSLPTE